MDVLWICVSSNVAIFNQSSINFWSPFLEPLFPSLFRILFIVSVFPFAMIVEIKVCLVVVWCSIAQEAQGFGFRWWWWQQSNNDVRCKTGEKNGYLIPREVPGKVPEKVPEKVPGKYPKSLLSLPRRFKHVWGLYRACRLVEYRNGFGTPGSATRSWSSLLFIVVVIVSLPRKLCWKVH